MALYFQDKYDEAIKAWNETTRIDPSYTKAWSNKGNAFKLLGKTSESNADYAKAKELWHNGYGLVQTHFFKNGFLA